MENREGISDSENLKPKSVFGVRHVQAVLLYLAMLLGYNMRTNLSMAIVVMTDTTKEHTFDWNSQTQSMIFSSFIWGYILLQLAAGELGPKFGGSILIKIAIGVNSAVCFLIPTAVYYGGWQALCACRALQGVSQGFLYPSMHLLITKWVPLEEKNRFGAFIYSGADLGTTTQMIASGFIADYWGWPAIFYINGTLGAIWTIAYTILGADSPRNSKIISIEEKIYIEKSLGHNKKEQKKLKTPWKAIATSLPFYALLVTQCGHCWAYWTLVTEIPTYIQKFLKVNIKTNGVMSGLPYLSMSLLGLLFGFVSDYAQKKKWLSISISRKISNTIGEWGPGFALLGLSYVPSGNSTLAAALMIVVVSLNAGYYTGYMMVHIDIAPNFAGILMAITNSMGNGIAMIASIVVGLILNNESDLDQWRKVFFLTASVYITTNLFFLLFGTSEKQSWNEPKEHKNETENNGEVLPLEKTTF